MLHLALPLLLLLSVVPLIHYLGEHPTLKPGVSLANTEVHYLSHKQAFPRELVDPAARRFILNEPPQRIVSGVLAGDEMLSRLVPHDRIASVTFFADVAGTSNVSGVYPPSVNRNYGTIEEYLSLQADLAIVAAYSDTMKVDMLMSSGIPVIRFAESTSYDDIRANVTTLAKALGSEIQAKRWLSDMDKRIAAVQNAVISEHRPRVLFYSLDGSSYGPGSLMDETLRYAGGINVMAETGLGAYPRLSTEMAIALAPDVILVSDSQAMGEAPAHEQLLTNPTWKDVPAIRQHRVYPIRGTWSSSSSPFRVKGIEVIARLLHPLRFDEEGL